ncbi:hypothetical protein EB118_13705 [bacterium]|nr:hypothetical protein [bacterium]NDD83041.1 hypothetical protein [bacterium]NDG31109.1 hypothetical protein [bacterium]
MEIEHLFFIILILWAVYTLTKCRDLFSGEVVANPFSDLMCITDDTTKATGEYPVFRIKGQQTFECLSKDNLKCMNRTDFDMPADARCTTFFGKDGIRNLNDTNKKIFNDFDSGKGSYLECTPDSLNNDNHWCGKLANTFAKECSSSDGFKVKYQSTCDGIAKNKTSPKTNKEYNVIDGKMIADLKQQSIQSTQATRSANQAQVATSTDTNRTRRKA